MIDDAESTFAIELIEVRNEMTSTNNDLCMIHVDCPNCSKTLTFELEFASSQGKCPNCRRSIYVPNTAMVECDPTQLSLAHLSLLARFRYPRQIDEVPRDDRWTMALGQTTDEAIRCFQSQGLICRQSVSSILDYKYGVAHLKTILKQHGLRVSGKKRELVARLLEADPVGCQELTADVVAFECSEKGRALANQFVSEEEEYRKEIELSVLNAVKQREFVRASELVAAFEARQLFPRGLNINWGKIDHEAVVRTLMLISCSKPSILDRLNDAQVEVCRIGASMQLLWGESKRNLWLPSDFDTGLHIDGECAARMIYFSVLHNAEMKEHREAVAEGILTGIYFEILTVKDECSCKACFDLDGKRYALDEVPELPHKSCSSELGCRCVIVGRFE
jgi:SAP domain